MAAVILVEREGLARRSRAVRIGGAPTAAAAPATASPSRDRARARAPAPAPAPAAPAPAAPVVPRLGVAFQSFLHLVAIRQSPLHGDAAPLAEPLASPVWQRRCSRQRAAGRLRLLPHHLRHAVECLCVAAQVEIESKV